MPGGVRAEGFPVGQIHMKTDVIRKGQSAADLSLIRPQTGINVSTGTSGPAPGGWFTNKFPSNEFRFPIFGNIVEIFYSRACFDRQIFYL